MIERELQEIGLNDKEAKIYLATLELGQATVQQISKKSGVNRATAYFIIEGLMKTGLISSFHKAKRQFFFAANPESLAELLEQQKQEVIKKENNLKKLLPQLRSVNNKAKDKPVVKYYEGKEGIKTMVEEITRATKKGITIRMAYSKDAVNMVLNQEQQNQIKTNRIKNKGKTQSIYTYKDGIIQNTIDGQRRKVPFDKFPIKSDIAIYDNKIRLASLGHRLIGIVIEDKELTDTLKAIMDLAWEGAGKYQKNYSHKK